MHANEIILHGHREPIVLLHGLYSSALEWQFIAKKFHEAGHTVIVPHLEGYSVGNACKMNKSTWESWLEVAKKRISKILEQHPTVAIGGLCIGANLALLLAAQFKNQISQLFLLSTTLYYDGWALPWYKFLIPLVYYTPIGRLYSYRERDPFGVKNQKMRRLIAHQMTQKYVSDAGAARLQSHGLYQVHRMIRQIKKVLPQIQTPVTIFHSTEDDMTSLRSADYLYKHIGSNHKSTVLLHDSYHMITLDNDRDKVANHIIMLLAINCPTKAKITLVA